MTPLAQQIAAELDRAITGPVRSLLGFDLADMLDERIRRHAAERIAEQLRSTNDHELAGTVIDLMCCLWPHGGPEDAGQPEWWGTPLGMACARSLGTHDTDTITQSAAAAILGVHPGTISQLAYRGSLERGADGRISRASVLARLTRLRGDDDA